MNSELKRCSKCAKFKILQQFSRDKSRRDGHSLWCKDCVRQYYKESRYKILKKRKQYYEENKEKILLYGKQYRKYNKDKLSKYKKNYNKKHKDKIAEHKKQYYEDNKEYKKQYMKRWHKINPEKNRERNRNRRSRKVKLSFDFDGNDERIALEYFNNCCAICGRSFNDLPISLCIAFDHWIPLSDKRPDNPGTVPTNMIPICHGENGYNNHKYAHSPEEWTIKTYGQIKGQEIINKIYVYFEWIKENNDGSRNNEICRTNI